jgi:VanZ family protein
MVITWFEKHNKTSWIFVILISIIIFYVSSLVLEPGKTTFYWKPIAYHFYAFFFLSVFLLISLTKGKNKKLIFLAIILAILYAISDELHQVFVPGRFFALSDILTDSAGILFAALIYLGLRFKGFKQEKLKKDQTYF